MGVKVVFATPTLKRPFEPNLKALRESVPVLDEAGIDHAVVYEIGNPYISAARATMTRKALDAKADIIVYIDHDLSWRPKDLLKLIQTEGEVVCGFYRFKNEGEEYMGTLDVEAPQWTPKVRADGAIKATLAPGGFLKVTVNAIARLMDRFPELCYGPKYHLSFDLFNHGAYQGAWWGEDFAFSRRWNEIGEIWLVPDLNLDHHGFINDKDGKPQPHIWRGNFHEFMLRQPGGVNDPARKAA